MTLTSLRLYFAAMGLVAGACGILCTEAVGASPDQPTAEEREAAAFVFREARRLWEAGNREAALDQFALGMLIDKTNPVAHYQLAELWSDAGDQDAALKHYRLAAKHGPAVKEGIIARAMVERHEAEQEARAQVAREFEDQVVAIETDMVLVRGGCFQMGSPESDPEHIPTEKLHEVCVDDFRINRYEVTEAIWIGVMGENPSDSQSGAAYPVENVSPKDIERFLDALHEKTSIHYRLPTEAEWEYACRSGGKQQKYCGGEELDKLSWNVQRTGDSFGKKMKVGQKAPNGLGLYDMTGNVWEWTCSAFDKNYGGSERICADRQSEESRVARGGSYDYGPEMVRAARRFVFDPRDRYDNIGFRLAQDKAY